MREIKVYVEGGGSTRYTKIPFREGFDAFFLYLKDLAFEHDCSLTFVPCGGIEETFRNFDLALTNNSDLINMLLVDADGSVINNASPKSHLSSRWHNSNATDKQCHLMVQIMESWFFANIDVLYDFYGIDRNNNSPLDIYQNIQNIQNLDKSIIRQTMLDISKCSSYGDYEEYGKVKQAVEILKELNLDIVREKASHCDEFCNGVESFIQQS